MLQKIPIFTITAGIVFLTALFLLGTDAGAEIYRYVDKDGTVHFSDVPIRGGHAYKPKGNSGYKRSYSGRYDISPRAARYGDMVLSAAAKTGLDPKLIRSVIQTESSWNHRAISKAGAMGLMQLMPATAKRYNVTDVFDARENVLGGSRYLKDLLSRYRGDLTLALAAYNAGETAVAKYAGVPPYRETRQYVKKVLRLYRGGTGSLKQKQNRIYRYADRAGNLIITDTPRSAAESH